MRTKRELERAHAAVSGTVSPAVRLRVCGTRHKMCMPLPRSRPIASRHRVGCRLATRWGMAEGSDPHPPAAELPPTRGGEHMSHISIASAAFLIACACGVDRPWRAFSCFARRSGARPSPRPLPPTMPCVLCRLQVLAAPLSAAPVACCSVERAWGGGASASTQSRYRS